MFELTITVDFEAAHCIPDYPGKCRRLHGHNWKVEVAVRGETLDSLGMLVDFRVLKNEVGKVIERLDHHYLNEVEPFVRMNPTAENIARFIYEELRSSPPLRAGIAIDRVKVWESPNSAAQYRPGE